MRKAAENHFLEGSIIGITKLDMSQPRPVELVSGFAERSRAKALDRGWQGEYHRMVLRQLPVENMEEKFNPGTDRPGTAARSRRMAAFCRARRSCIRHETSPAPQARSARCAPDGFRLQNGLPLRGSTADSGSSLHCEGGASVADPPCFMLFMSSLTMHNIVQMVRHTKIQVKKAATAALFHICTRISSVSPPQKTLFHAA